MKLLFAILLFVVIANGYEKDIFNEFSADVDIYDMGTMGRGKNACSWHRSLKNKQEIFYYLAMQPWRHLVWTDCTGTECYKFFINEDASKIPDGKTKLSNTDINNDYCRKEYANQLPVFDIDWTQIDERGRLETVDINGQTCYKYPAQQPLAYIYLQQQYMSSLSVASVTPCRYDFIGGKSITFRSFNKFSDVFITSDKLNGYLGNKTRCNIDPSPNNVDTDLAIVLGISDVNIVQTINSALAKLGDLKTVKQVKIYYLSGNSVKIEVVELKNLASLISKQIAGGSVDALINSAKSDLIKRIKSKAIYRGTIIALMDRTLASTFDAETAFDRNNITVHTIVYNPRGDIQMRLRARTLLSVGDHYHEFSTKGGIPDIVNDLFVGVRTNLTERCNRTSCDGFCDGRDRCTCPMCCENTCFYSYCNTTTATCKPWPEANPRPKITCTNDCIGKQECKDLEGCVYTEYKAGCEPRAKCMRPFCRDDGKCDQEPACEKDKTPSFENKCWSYTCNEKNGNCERLASGAACPKLPDLCHEYVCDSNLKCTYQKKTCVKTAPYTEMKCYKAQCNKKTGMCENVLNCESALSQYTGCGKQGNAALCKCGSDFSCSCTSKSEEQLKAEGYCKQDEICDSTDESNPPKCKTSKCGQDLYIEGCLIKTCNENSGEIEWVNYDCSKNVTIKAGGDKATEAQKYCLSKFEIVCDSGECLAQQKEDVSLQAACGECAISEPVVSKDGYLKTYTVTYTEDCNYLTMLCPNGKPIPGHEKWFEVGKDGKPIIGKCLPVDPNNENGERQCQYAPFKNEFKGLSGFDICSECYDTATCYKNKDYRTYTYDHASATCSMETHYDNQKQCTVCNEAKDGWTETCKDLSVDKTWTTIVDSKTLNFQYKIPKVCYPGDQCIPTPNFDCTDQSNGDIGRIYELLGTCANADGVKAEYHYSSLFEENKYYNDLEQSAEFLAEMEKEAYCSWSFKLDSCKYCSIQLKDGARTPVDQYSSKQGDKCDDMKQEFNNKGLGSVFTFKCNTTTNECDATLKEQDCNPVKCWYYSQNQQSGKCENTTIGTCESQYEIERSKLNAYQAPTEGHNLGDKFPQVMCRHSVECDNNDQITCKFFQGSEPCAEALEKYKKGEIDFGCRRPKETCNFETLRCEFEDLNMTDPRSDVRFFYERDNVVFDNLCYQYTCQEFFNETTKSLEHHWVQTPESLEQLNMLPESICDTVKCNPATGRSESERRQCDPIIDYGLSETMAQCFQCSCSMMTGDNILAMRPDTEEFTYELDACGNCVVKDRATGQQVNEAIPCVLAQPVNLTGAIAGATVAASVVFGLIGSMVVVSIGAFQTYQLVSSAMKNVISTTLENPEFVAADNEATNALAE